jgi:hypothetical protein
MSEIEPVPAVPEPNPGSPPGIPWWRHIVSQYFVPTALATVIASGLSIYTALATAHEKQQEYNEKFEQLVTDKSIFDAFGGYYRVGCATESDPRNKTPSCVMCSGSSS